MKHKSSRNSILATAQQVCKVRTPPVVFREPVRPPQERCQRGRIPAASARNRAGHSPAFLQTRIASGGDSGVRGV